MNECMKKAKTHLELNLVQDLKGNKKGFYNYTCSKRRAGKNADPLLNGARVRHVKEQSS